MADDLTPGEIRRTLDRIERQQQDTQRAMDDRVTKLAADMVPTSLWAAEHKALADDVRDLASDMQQAVTRIEATSLERMQTLRGEIKSVRQAQQDHAKVHEAAGAWSRSKTLTVVGIVVGAAATLAAAWIAAVLAAKGVG